MEAGALTRLSWRVRSVARALDWTLAAALGLAAFAVGFHFFSVAPAVAQTQVLRAVAAQLHAAQALQAQPPAPQDARTQLAAFYGALAPRERVPDLLRRLHGIAAEQELIVEQADYRPVPEVDGRLVRYQLTLPVVGTYPGIRRFLAQAGKRLPGLALDGVTFQRRQAADEYVEAQLRLTLFVDTGSVPARGAQ